LFGKKPFTLEIESLRPTRFLEQQLIYSFKLIKIVFDERPRFCNIILHNKNYQQIKTRDA
jgi:hypothetical protein